MRILLLALLLAAPVAQADEDDIRRWAQCASMASILGFDSEKEEWRAAIREAQAKMNREDAMASSRSEGFQYGWYSADAYVEVIIKKRARQYNKKCVSL